MNTHVSKILGEAVRPPTEEEQTNPEEAYQYALGVVEGPWPDLEPVILQDPTACYLYAGDVLNTRWPKAERMILKDPLVAHEYARNVIQGRWPEYEKSLKHSAERTYHYVKDVVQAPFPEGELTLLRDPHYKAQYFKLLKTYGLDPQDYINTRIANGDLHLADIYGPQKA